MSLKKSPAAEEHSRSFQELRQKYTKILRETEMEHQTLQNALKLQGRDVDTPYNLNLKDKIEYYIWLIDLTDKMEACHGE